MCSSHERRLSMIIDVAMREVRDQVSLSSAFEPG